MSRDTEGLAATIAILVGSRRAGDRLGERIARKRLADAYGVRICFTGRGENIGHRAAQSGRKEAHDA